EGGERGQGREGGGGDQAKDEDGRPPAPYVPLITEVCLIDAVAVDAEVEHLYVGAERVLEMVSPRIRVPHLQAEGERVPDDGDPVAGTPGVDNHAGLWAPESLAAA